MVRKASLRLAGSLAIIGGALMVASGFAVHGFLLSTLTLVSGHVSEFLPSEVSPLIVIILEILTGLIALGGITVILGGLALLVYARALLGRILIALGGGAGLLSFLVSLGYSMLTAGPLTLSIHAAYWTGLVLAVVARRIAK